MSDYTAILKPDCIYHIYNRANGNEKIFIQPDNYEFFLKKYKQHIYSIADTFCYCLMPNHFHFLVRIKSETALSNLAGFENITNPTGFENLSGLISQRFGNCFNSYSKAINKQEGRKGGLFIRPFKRKKIENLQYLRKVVHYIHFNPVEAGLCKTPEKHKYSSFTSLISNSKTLLNRDETISWFDDLENFIYIHKHPPELTGIDLTFM